MLQDDPHPLVQELASLRQTAARFQHEAHDAALRLQRHSLDSSRLHEHATALEQQNKQLLHEIQSLRASPDTTQHPEVAHVQELTLALRRISEKMDLTENTLLERSNELVDADSELVRARHLADGAYELAARMRAREEAANARERDLEFKARASEEERKMVDLVVQEYADLVRNLEGRRSSVNHTPSISNGSASTITLVDNLQDGKSSLHRILTEFSTESEKLHATIAELNSQIALLQTTLDAERKAASHDRALLAQTKVELDKLNLEDQTAAKMVSRYMKFSQASTNALQEQITTLKTRHAATTATLDFQLSIAESQLVSERARASRLQDALDEVCEDLARESYGRRREVALRLALISREEGIAEFMRRWVRRASESYERCYPHALEQSTPKSSLEGGVQEAFHRVVSDAETLLSALHDDVQCTDAIRASGSLARIALSREAVETLRRELQEEVQKRVEAIRRSAAIAPNGHIEGVAPGVEALAPNGSIPSQGDDEMPDPLPATPWNGDAALEQGSMLEMPQPDSLLSIVGPKQDPMEDPFVVAALAPPVVELTAPVPEVDTVPPADLPLPLVQPDSSPIPTLLVHEEPKAVQQSSPAVSMLDLAQEHPSPDVGDPAQTDANSVQQPPDTDAMSPILDEASTNPNTPVEATTVIPALIFPAASPSSPRPSDPLTQLISDLGATKHRYDDLRRAFRDCSLALKELKRTLPSSPRSLSPTPSSHTHSQFRSHLTTALSRIDDYVEDARVELEIRISDEELTARGFQTVLSVPGALGDLCERAEVEEGARRFVDGRDDGVGRERERFGRKVEDVEHDVAVLKRAVHALALYEGGGGVLGDEESVGLGLGGDGDGQGGGGGWTAWTAGLLGANAGQARPRSPVPAQTFGTVMTSPRLRHAASLKQLQLHGQGQGQGHSQDSAGDRDRGPLAGLGLRIAVPLPSPSLLPVPSPGRYPGLGIGAGAGEGGAPPRTMSAMYAVGMGVGVGVGVGGVGFGFGRRRSSVGMGVGLGTGTPLPSPGRRGSVGVGGGVGVGAGSPLRSSGFGPGNAVQNGHRNGGKGSEGVYTYDLSGDVE